MFIDCGYLVGSPPSPGRSLETLVLHEIDILERITRTRKTDVVFGKNF
jgi:hypothetical protein